MESWCQIITLTGGRCRSLHQNPRIKWGNWFFGILTFPQPCEQSHWWRGAACKRVAKHLCRSFPRIRRSFPRSYRGKEAIFGTAHIGHVVAGSANAAPKNLSMKWRTRTGAVKHSVSITRAPCRDGLLDGPRRQQRTSLPVGQRPSTAFVESDWQRRFTRELALRERASGFGHQRFRTERNLRVCHAANRFSVAIQRVCPFGIAQRQNEATL